MGLLNKIKNFYHYNKAIVKISTLATILTGIGVLLSNDTQAQDYSPTAISEDEAKHIDTIVAQNYELNPVDFHTTQTVYTTAGNRWDIPMAVTTSNDTVAGGDFSGYAWVHNTTPDQRTVLRDSLPNTCIDILDLNDYTPEEYQEAAENHWDGCGYFPTAINPFTEPTSTLNVQAYPNPFTNGFTIKPNEDISRIVMYNQLGQEIYRNNSEVKADKTLTINQELSNGVYIMKLINDKNEVVTKKLVKQ